MTHPLATQHLGRAVSIIAIASLFGALAYLGVTLTRDQSRIAAVWLPNAVLVAIMLRKPSCDPLLVMVAFLANIIANLFAGDMLGRAIGLSLVNSIEITIACGGMRLFKQTQPDMERKHDLLAFCFFGGLIAPTVAGCVAAAILSYPGTLDPKLWLTWTLTDSLGLMMVSPAIWVALDAWKHRRRPTTRRAAEWIAVVLGVVVVTVLVFTQNRFPFLYIVTPMVLLSAFRLGAFGAAVATITVATIASVATAANQGPISLVVGDMSDRLHVLQGFLAVNFAMSLPVAASLASRAAIANSLFESETLNRSILDNMREIIFKTDAAGRWVFLNPAWETVTGYGVNESIGWATTRLLHPDDKAAAADIYPAIISGEISEITLKQRFQRRSGESAHIEVSIRRLCDERGRFAGTTGNIRDVTEIVNQQKVIAERDAQFITLADHATDAVFRLTLDGACLYASPSAEKLLGIAPEHLKGVSMLDRFHPDDDHHVRGTFAALAEGSIEGRLLAYRSELVHEPGTYRWLEANCGLLRDPVNQRPKEIIASIRDVSASKALESELQAARKRAEHAANAKSAFLATMSHEIRTPMNGVIGFTQLLLTTQLDDQQRRYLQLVDQSGKSMMALLNDILDIAKIEAGQMGLLEEQVYLAQQLSAVVDLMQPLAQSKNVELTLTVDPLVPERLLSDSLRLRQVMLNLVGNAVKFTEQGSIHVHAERLIVSGDAAVCITVQDTGIGIASDRLEAIFDTFSQADNSVARRFGGTGLGLSISMELVKLMGGSIAVNSVEGEGTSFLVTLPLRETLEHAAALTSCDNMNVASDPMAPPRPYVLIAEDNPINQVLVLALLEQAGVDVVLVADGREVIEEIESARHGGKPFDFVLMDVQMPEIDGLEATRRLRAMGICADELPIVALTANAYADDVARCLEAGMQHHLSKPIDPTELRQVVARYVGAEVELPALPLEPPVASGASTALPLDLVQQYAERRQATLDLLSAIRGRSSLEQAELKAVSDMLHKLAGTAALFGEEELGEVAGELEHKLVGAPAHARFEIVRAGLDAMRRCSAA